MISFKQLEQFLKNSTLNLVIAKTENGIAVSVLPQPKVDDKAKENLIPLILKGTAEELDAEFMTLISSQLEKTTGIITNIAEFEAQSKEMKAKSEAEKKAKESKKKLDEASKKKLEGADKLLTDGKYDECQKKIDEALKDNDDYTPALTLQKKLDKVKPQTISMFNETEIPPKPTPEQEKEEVKVDEQKTVVDKELPKTTAEVEEIQKLQEYPKTVEESFVAPKPEPQPVKADPQGNQDAKLSLTLDKAMELYGDRLTEAERESIKNGQSTQEVLDRLKNWYIEDQAKTQPPKRLDFESLENYENRVKAWEKTQAGEMGLDEINEVAKASPNVEVVTLPPQQEAPGIKPNTSFDEEINPEEDAWAKREADSQNLNNNLNLL